MNYQKFSIFVLILLIGVCNAFAGNSPKAGKSQSVTNQFINHQDWNFAENKGQIATPGIKYYGHQGGIYLYCKPGVIEFVFTKVGKEDDEQVSEATGGVSDVEVQNFEPLHRKPNLSSKITTSRADLILIHSNPSAQIIASDQQEYYENYYTTGDANHGITHVHTYKTITYKDIYPHIDMVLHACPNGSSGRATEGAMKYEFVVYPGGKVNDIRIQWNGLENMQMTENGGIEYAQALGKMTETAPYSFVREEPSVRPDAIYPDKGRIHGSAPYALEKIESHFVLKNNLVSFKTGKYDKTKTLVLDPKLEWATYFGALQDAGEALAIDTSGHVFMAGYAFAPGAIVTTSGAYQATIGGGDAFLVKFTDKGFPLWATYYGGPADDNGTGVATDISGDVYLTGTATSDSGIATNGAFLTTNGISEQKAFLAKFDSSGQIKWATYYGGNKFCEGQGVGVDASGNAYIGGTTNSSTGIGTIGAYQSAYGTGNPEYAFVAKFNSGGALQWGTYYGGGAEQGIGFAVDSKGNSYITGETFSITGIATSGAYQASIGYSMDGYLAKFNSGGGLAWGTYFGGSNEDYGKAVAVDRNGDVFITGSTRSDTGISYNTSFQADLDSGGNNGFLAKFDKAGTIQWATYLGGRGGGIANGITTDLAGNVYITGTAGNTSNMTTPDGNIPSINVNRDAFISQFTPGGDLKWGTYFVGNGYNSGNALVFDSSANLYITGQTFGVFGLATSGAYQTANGGNAGNAFLAKFSFPGNDAGIDSFFAPGQNVCSDSQPVTVQLKNYSENYLDSVRINISVNGVLQKIYHWHGLLAPDSVIKINVGLFSFPTGKNVLGCWTSFPNGLNDINHKNDTSSLRINVIPPPLVKPGKDTTICANSPISIGGTAINGDTYSWTSNPLGFSSTISNSTVNPSQTTTYYLTVTVTATGCSSTGSVTITVKPLPFANTGLHKSVCKGDSLKIGAASIAGYLYSWTSSPAGFNSSVSNPEIFPQSSVLYTLRVTDTTGGCSNSASVLITVNPLPTVNMGQNITQICNGARVKLGGNALPELVYAWSSNPKGFTSTLSDPVLTPVSGTKFFLTVKDTITGCTNKDSITVTLTASQAPVADAGPNQTICEGDSGPVGSHGITGNSYAWTSNPLGFSSAFSIPIVKPVKTTSYFVTVKNAAGCVNFDSVIIFVNPKPKLKPGMPQVTCGGMAIRLGDHADSGITYLWSSNPRGFNSKLSDPIDSPKVTTVYHLKETIIATGCSDSDTVRVTIIQRPNLSFNIYHVDGFEYLFTLKNQGYPPYLYHWNFGDSLNSKSDTASGYNATYTYSRNGKYHITITFLLPGFCLETDTVLLNVNEQFSLNIFPNPFQSQTDINYTLAGPAHVRISITDEVGQQLGTLLDKQLTQGVYNTYFDATLWKARPSMYFILFQLDDKLIVKKIIQLDSIYH